MLLILIGLRFTRLTVQITGRCNSTTPCLDVTSYSQLQKRLVFSMLFKRSNRMRVLPDDALQQSIMFVKLLRTTDLLECLLDAILRLIRGGSQQQRT
jgi:hypothetical protein